MSKKVRAGKDDNYVIDLTVTPRVTNDATVTNYSGRAQDLAEVTGALADGDQWTVQIEIDEKKQKVKSVSFPSGRTGPYPGLRGNHYDGKEMKYDIERGTGTVDRLFAKAAQPTITRQTAAKEVENKKLRKTEYHIDLTVGIQVDARVEEDTH